MSIAKRAKKGPTEAEFTRQVLQLANLRGWRTAHFRAAQTKTGKWITAVQGDGKGFPDLLMIRCSDLLAIELKVGKNTTTLEQDAWLDAFKELPNTHAAVWTPEQWDEIEFILENGYGY